MGTSSASGRNLFTKGRAILAGGAMVTLAAWNDSEFATGEFGAGEFMVEVLVLQTSASGVEWRSSPVESVPLKYVAPLSGLRAGFFCL
jgi:predicted ribosomally synthesized peptide with SipW-like signal peptide